MLLFVSSVATGYAQKRATLRLGGAACGRRCAEWAIMLQFSSSVATCYAQNTSRYGQSGKRYGQAGPRQVLMEKALPFLRGEASSKPEDPHRHTPPLSLVNASSA